jgi:hypothetical protein
MKHETHLYRQTASSGLGRKRNGIQDQDSYLSSFISDAVRRDDANAMQPPTLGHSIHRGTNKSISATSCCPRASNITAHTYI